MSVIIDSSIVQKYINGEKTNTYKESWIYSSFGRGSVFEEPDPANKAWVSKLCDKLINQIRNYKPGNSTLVKSLFPDFDEVSGDFTIMLVVGFPDPYDAMVMEHDGKSFMIFDLIQFGENSLNDNFSCHRILTHELIHICLHNQYPQPTSISYKENLCYTAFDEGFAHALAYPENIDEFIFDEFLQEKFDHAKSKLLEAIAETDINKQKELLISADTGRYWDKFASIAGKLYLLKNINEIDTIYQEGWYEFADKIIDCR